MKTKPGYKKVPFSFLRQMAAASASVLAETNSIHSITEVDVSLSRRKLKEYHSKTGKHLSLTGFVVASLAQAIQQHPELNSFRKGKHLILLDDVTISTLVERELDGERIPEPLGIQAAQKKTLLQIHEEIRSAQNAPDKQLGGLSGMSWIRFLPGFLFRFLIRLASRHIGMVQTYGTVAVTSVGMFGNRAMWFVPVNGATVAVTVGSFVDRPVLHEGHIENREHLCLTVSFDHDIVDGAPAARFMKTFAGILERGDVVDSLLPSSPSGVEHS